MSENGTSFRDLKLDEIKSMIDSGEYEVVDVREGW
jgi:anti-sigma28 factor (negative regulator of flagellin synthesis)